MFSHIMVGSNDIDRSKKLYDALFVAMGGKPGVVDARGRTLPCQWIEDPDGDRLVLRATDIPGMGCKAYSLVRRKRSSRARRSDVS